MVLAGFNEPSIRKCNLRLSWSNLDGPIELMTMKEKFVELKECSGKRRCKIPLSKLSKSPFNLVEGQLLIFRGNGPYGGRFYFDWKKSSLTNVSPPNMEATLNSRGLKLKWARQSKAKFYQVTWNTRNQACNKFVPLAKTSKTSHLIPTQLISGKMQFKIRATNHCNVASSYSRTMILTVSTK